MGTYFSIFGQVLTIICCLFLYLHLDIYGAVMGYFHYLFCNDDCIFITGQKHYPIPYKVKNDVFYVFVIINAVFTFSLFNINLIYRVLLNGLST